MIKNCTVEGIKFPCRYFVQIKTKNNKNILVKSEKSVELINGIATFNQAINFDIDVISFEGNIRYLMGQDRTTHRKWVQTMDLNKKQRN